MNAITDVGALADEIERVLNVYLETCADAIPHAKAKQELLQILWDDKRSIVAALRKSAQPETRVERDAVIEECAQAAINAVPVLPMGQIDASEACDTIQDEIVRSIRALLPAIAALPPAPPILGITTACDLVDKSSSPSPAHQPPIENKEGDQS